MYIYTKRLFSLVIIFLYCFFTKNAGASVVINEIYPNPVSGEYEVVELHNTSETQTFSLKNWQLWDNRETTGLLHTFSIEEIDPNAYFTIFLQNKLNNSGDSVYLISDTNTYIDQMSYTSSSSGLSIARIPNATGPFIETSSSLGFMNPPLPIPSLSPSPSLHLLPTATPITDQPTVIPTQPGNIHPIASSPDILLSEIMACPEDGSEWIELQNTTSQNLSLSGWSIWDSQSMLYQFSTETISDSGFISIDIQNKLNNDGDQIRLIDSTSTTAAVFTYTDCIKGASFIHSDSSWQISTQPTKNAKNIVTPETYNQNESPITSSTNTTSDSNQQITASSSQTPQNSTNSAVTQNYSFPKQPTQNAILLTKSRNTFFYKTKLTLLPESLSNAANLSTFSLPESHLAFQAPNTSGPGAISLILGGGIFVLLGGYYLIDYISEKIDNIY